MSPTMVAIQAGVRRGGIELRQTFTNFQDLWNYIFLPAVFLVVMYFLRGKAVPGTDFSLSAATIPSVFGMQIVFAGLDHGRDDPVHGEGGWDAAPGQGDAERDAGLPRRQDRPDLRDVDGLGGDHPGPRRAPLRRAASWAVSAAWFTLIWVLLLGLVATMPMGAVLGSLFSDPEQPRVRLRADDGAYRHLRNLLPHNRLPGVVAVDRAGVSHLLGGPRDALGVSPGFARRAWR